MALVGLLILLTLASAKLYRMGGTGGSVWGNTKWRDWGCNTMAIIAVAAQSSWSWYFIPVWFFLWAALSTYWKKKGTDSKWWNWALTGAGYGLAWYPIYFITYSFFGLLCYTVFVTVFTTVWSLLIDDVEWEERGRGAIVVAATPLLLWR